MGTQRYAEQIRARLGPEIDALREQGKDIEVHEREIDRHRFWDFHISSASEGLFVCGWEIQRLVAGVLADVITFDVERALIDAILRADYPSVEAGDRKRVIEEALNILREREPGRSRKESYPSHRDNLFRRILDYFQYDLRIHLDGFIRFRLKDHVTEIRTAVETAVDNYLVEKEYNEFIRLLKYFVDIQEPRFDEVHVIMGPDGVFRLLDTRYRLIDGEYLEEDPELPEENNEVNHEDMLISALITLAPRHIVLHLSRSLGILATIRSIFEERVSICTGCPLCDARGVAYMGVDPAVTNSPR